MNEVMIPFSELQQMAVTMAKSGMFGKTPEQMLSLMMIAQAENLHPALAAMEYDIIQGRPALKGQAALARFQQAGGSVRWLIKTDAEAKAVFSHPQGGELTVSWTIDRARKMNLDQKDNWKKQPGIMLSWRCVSEGVRAVFPACLNRMYLSEEVQDFEPLRNVTVDTNPEDFVNSAPLPEKSGKEDATDWVKKAAELTEKHKIDEVTKARIWKESGCTAEAYCKKIESDYAETESTTTTTSPAHPETETEGDDFQLNGGPDMKELVATLEEYRSLDGIPAAAKKDIDAALSRNETDIKVLSALIEKVKAALNA